MLFQPNDIQRRYFLTVTKAANYSEERAEGILNAMFAHVDSIIEKASEKLPSHSLKAISQPIFEVMRQAKERLLK